MGLIMELFCSIIELGLWIDHMILNSQQLNRCYAVKFPDVPAGPSAASHRCWCRPTLFQVLSFAASAMTLSVVEASVKQRGRTVRNSYIQAI
jgi:hypothetical protein